MPNCLLTLGSPLRLLVEGVPYTKINNAKHLALLAYLKLQPGEHDRLKLTRDLWGRGKGASMDNALSQLRGFWGEEVFPLRTTKIQFTGELECDAVELLAAPLDAVARRAVLHLYRGPFLEGLKLQDVSAEFGTWVEERRAQLTTAFLSLCESECGAAAAGGCWTDVDEIATRGVLYAPSWIEGAHWQRAAAQALHSRLAPNQDHHSDSRPARSEEPRGVLAPPAEARPAPLKEPATSAPAPPSSVLSELPAKKLRVRMHGARAALLVGLVLIAWRVGLSNDDVPPESARAVLPQPGSPIRMLGDWVRTDGRWIYYRYESYLPAACDGGTEAVGNWGEDSWDEGLPVVCLNEAWLAWDVHQFRGRDALDAETTFCVNFARPQNGTRGWGQHGARRAPGIEQIAVYSPQGDLNIGFAAARDAGGEPKVVLTNKFPGPRC